MNSDTNLLPSSHGDDFETSGPAQGGRGRVRGQAGHLGECPCCGGSAGIYRRPSYSAVRRAVAKCAGGVTSTWRAGGQIPPCPGTVETRDDVSATSQPVGPLPLRGDAGRPSGDVEAVPRQSDDVMPKWDAFIDGLKPGLRARWGALCEFGVADLRLGDGSYIVEPLALRTARMWALNVGCWGLGTELSTRRRLRVWTSRLRGLWTTRTTAYTSSRIDAGDQGGLHL
jgi:hypothetical protein